MKTGDRVKIISVPDCCLEDLGKCGTVMATKTFYGGVDVLLDGDDGLTAIYEHQLQVQN